MIALFGQLLPNLAGLVIAPGSIIIIVVILATANGRRNALYLILSGYLAAIGVLWIGQFAGTSASTSGTVDWQSYLTLFIGALFAVLAVPQFRAMRHPKAGGPSWLAKLDDFGVWQSLALGLYCGAINVKSLPLLLHSGLTIGHAKLDPTSELIFVLLFALLALTPLIVPLLISVLAGAKGVRILAAIREFLTVHSAVIMATLFVVLAAVFIGKGIEALTHA